jgi:hypothetical protein
MSVLQRWGTKKDVVPAPLRQQIETIVSDAVTARLSSKPMIPAWGAA